jgi:hypothetical protein
VPQLYHTQEGKEYGSGCYHGYRREWQFLALLSARSCCKAMLHAGNTHMLHTFPELRAFSKRWPSESSFLLIQEMSRSHAKLPLPEEHCVWHPCLHGTFSFSNTARLAAAALLSPQWLRYFVSKSVRGGAKGFAIVEYHQNVINAIAPHAQMLQSSGLSVALVLRLWLLRHHTFDVMATVSYSLVGGTAVVICGFLQPDAAGMTTCTY